MTQEIMICATHCFQDRTCLAEHLRCQRVPTLHHGRQTCTNHADMVEILPEHMVVCLLDQAADTQIQMQYHRVASEDSPALDSRQDCTVAVESSEDCSWVWLLSHYLVAGENCYYWESSSPVDSLLAVVENILHCHVCHEIEIWIENLEDVS